LFSKGIHEITADGPVRRWIPRTITLRFDSLPPVPIINFEWLRKEIDSDDARALGMYYVSCRLLRNGFLPEINLSFYLTLEILIGEKALIRKSKGEFYFIRTALVHTQIEKNKEGIKKFLRVLLARKGRHGAILKPLRNSLVL
jgi:hypothetical protein